MKNFRDVLDECGLMDLGFVGSKFTWFKNIANGILVWERLDRVLGTMDWFENYPATKVVILECGMSDHKPMLIHPCGVLVRQNKSWRFEKMWLEEKGCHYMVNLAWREGEGSTPMGGVVNKVGKCQVKLKMWSKRCFKNVTWEIAQKKKRMREAENSALQGNNVELVAKLKGEFVGLLANEEQM